MIFKNLRGEVKLNEPMSGHTSFRIGGPADVLVLPADREDLTAVIAQAREKGLPFMVIGGGTNLLVKDGGIRGVVVSLAKMSALSITRSYRSVGGAFAEISAEAGAGLPQLLSFTVEQGLTGLEYATGIPGTVGGAVCMNAGTAQGEIGDVIDTVTLLSPEGDVVTRQRDEMAFGYRTAAVPPDHVIVEVRIVLRHGERDAIKARVRELQESRKKRQPWGLPNAGSVFKNPLDEAAGKLIETAGLKGLTVGRAQISEKHANVIVNLGGARAADVLKLVSVVKERVLEVHKIRLELEIKVVGEDA